MATNDNTHAYALRIDGPLLRRQRQWLLDLAEKTTGDGQEHLEGILALLDEIADHHDRHGIDCLLKPESGETGKTLGPNNEFRCKCELPGHFWLSACPAFWPIWKTAACRSEPRCNGATSVAAIRPMRRPWTRENDLSDVLSNTR